MNPKTKYKTNHTANREVYNLLSDSEALIGVDRNFWLKNYSLLSEKEQDRLAQLLSQSEKEFQREQENHMSRVAEINAKCAAQLAELKKANNKLKAIRDEEQEDVENFDPDSILRELHDAGEY